MQALLIYGTYTAFNNIKFGRGAFRSSKDAYDAVVQAIREGVRGHECSARKLRSRWTEEPRTIPNIQAAPSYSLPNRHKRLRTIQYTENLKKRKSYDHRIHWPSKKQR